MESSGFLKFQASNAVDGPLNDIARRCVCVWMGGRATYDTEELWYAMYCTMLLHVDDRRTTELAEMLAFLALCHHEECAVIHASNLGVVQVLRSDKCMGAKHNGADWCF